MSTGDHMHAQCKKGGLLYLIMITSIAISREEMLRIYSFSHNTELVNNCCNEEALLSVEEDID